MSARTLRLPSIVFAAAALAANGAWGLGFRLRETKEQLRLKYDVSVVDHGTGRVTVDLTIDDPGRVKPLTSVDLVVLNKETKDGSGPVDLSVALAMSGADGKRWVSVHLTREMAERAEIQLKTSFLDGKNQGLTWYYHAIPIADYLKVGGQKKG
jgi:hypothetical protein